MWRGYWRGPSQVVATGWHRMVVVLTSLSFIRLQLASGGREATGLNCLSASGSILRFFYAVPPTWCPGRMLARARSGPCGLMPCALTAFAPFRAHGADASRKPRVMGDVHVSSAYRRNAGGRRGRATRGVVCPGGGRGLPVHPA